MKKSKAITLVLVTALLGCSRSTPDHNRLYMRTDSTGGYTPARSYLGYYYIFRPYGNYYGYGYGRPAGYVREGYSNAGVHGSEAGISRGGFGSTGAFHASSSS